MKRPYLGRVGAAALILVAVAATAQAVTTGAQRTVQQVDALPTRAHSLMQRLGAAPAAPAPAPVPSASPPEVPLGRPSVRVPILMYHYIRENPDPHDQMGFNLSVTPADFRLQMDWLEANGYHPVDFDDLRAYYAGQRPLPARPVVLTFDDGYRDLYTTAYPILREHGFKAVAYIVSGFLGAPNNVDANQVRTLDGNGIQIGSHTVSHVDLVKTSDAELAHQLRDSKATLEALLGHPVPDFCYPAGRFDARVVNAVRAAGYDTATTTAPGVLHSAGDRWTWTRVRVSGGEQLDRFARELADTEATVTPPVRPDAVPYLQRQPRLPLVYPLAAPPRLSASVSPPPPPPPDTLPLQPLP